MKIKCYGKLNLALEILGKTSNNMHELDMIMQNISIYDVLEIKKADDITVFCSGLTIDENNTVHKAAKYFFEYTKIKGGMQATIEKHIPSCAGLGGGSSNGAAALVGLNELYNTNLSIEELIKIGVQIGADVPFFLNGGTKRAKGIGEILIPVNNNLNLEYLLIKGEKGVSTGLCYENCSLEDTKTKQIDKIVNALEKGDRKDYFTLAKNHLQASAIGLLQEIDVIIKECYKEKSDFALMTGSGSCVFGVFEENIDHAKKHFEKKQPYVTKAVDVKSGYEII